MGSSEANSKMGLRNSSQVGTSVGLFCMIVLLIEGFFDAFKFFKGGF